MTLQLGWSLEYCSVQESESSDSLETENEPVSIYAAQTSTACLGFRFVWHVLRANSAAAA